MKNLINPTWTSTRQPIFLLTSLPALQIPDLSLLSDLTFHILQNGLHRSRFRCWAYRYVPGLIVFLRPLFSAPWTLTPEISAQQLVEHPLLHCWVCIESFQASHNLSPFSNFYDETNWSVFRRRTQDPPFDETTSTCAPLSSFQNTRCF